MKVNREQLKALIKECMVEILSEGLGRQAFPAVPRLVPVAEQHIRRSTRSQFDPRLDTPVAAAAARAPTEALKEAVRREAGGNPIMEAIFADTARTTLPSMLSHGDVGTPSPGSSGGTKIAQQEQFHGTPEEAFGEDNVGRWADLAFMESPSKKTA